MEDSKSVQRDYIGNIFRPRIENCDKHGPTQRNSLDADGCERSYAGCPRCIAESALRDVMERAAVPLRFQSKRFTDYAATNAGQKNALAAALDYAKTFSDSLESGRSIIFCGKPGTGKTHLAAAVINEIMTKGYGGVYSTVIEAVRRVKETWSRDSEITERGALMGFVAPDLLVLDEVGVQFGSEAERLILFEIINGRYENMMPTLLMSNLGLAGIEENIGPRAVDRLRENGGRVVLFDWESYRKTQ